MAARGSGKVFGCSKQLLLNKLFDPSTPSNEKRSQQRKWNGMDAKQSFYHFLNIIFHLVKKQSFHHFVNKILNLKIYFIKGVQFAILFENVA